MAQPTTGVYFSQSAPAAPPGDQIAQPQTDGASPEQSVTFIPQRATTSLRGTVKPDGTSITIDSDGTIHAVGGGGGGGAGGTTTSGGGIWVTPSGATDGSNTQFTIPATVLAGTAYFYMRNGVGQPQLGANARYAVQGTQLTTTTPLQSDDWHEFYFVPGSAISDSGGGGSVTPVAPGTIRGTSTGAAATGSNSFAVAWPTGTAVGDFVVIFADSDWNLATPSGWTANDLSNGSTWNGTVISRVMTSGDISTGSVAITSAGNQDYAFIAVAFIGPTGGMREADGLLNGAGVPFTVTTSGAVQATDVGLYFASGRASGTAWTIGRGAALTAVTGPNSQSNLNAEAITAGGAVSVPFTVSGGGAGRYNAVAIVKGS